MSYFLITPELKDDLRRCREYAEAPDHWYRPGPDAVPPGDIPEHVFNSGTVRAVFSWTLIKEKTYRHLSVSTGAPGRYPLPVVVFTLADMFGFTGGTRTEDGVVKTPAQGWGMQADQQYECIVVVQEVPDLPGAGLQHTNEDEDPQHCND